MRIVLLTFICLLFFSCSGIVKSEKYEINVNVVDMNGNPIKNRKLKIKNLLPLKLDSVITDNKGKATIKFDFERDVSGYDISIRAEDDSLFKAVNLVSRRRDDSKAGQTFIEDDIIQMDSIVPFKVRIKSSKNDVVELQIELEMGRYNDFRIINRAFNVSFIKRPISSLDTVITTSVFSKAPFHMQNRLVNNKGDFAQGRYYVIDSTFDRKVLFIDEIF
jgi:hypothetical protein